MEDKQPYIIIKDGYFYKEIYTEIEERDVREWLYKLGLDIGDMYLYSNGTSYHSLKRLDN